MAETNLGQVVGIWLEPTEPTHKNVLWIKTINQLTSEKTGFIWNGTEWINIQGLGFSWKGEFDENTDYTKNDVVKFEDNLYIKLNEVVSNGDNPDEIADFDLFLPSATPTGVEGSVQVKDANGKLFGSNLLSFIAGLFSIYGNFFLKSNSSTSGNAVEVKNLGNKNLQTISNDGKKTRDVSIFQQDGVVTTIAESEDVKITHNFSDSGQQRGIFGKQYNLTLEQNTVSTNREVYGERQVFTETGLAQGAGGKSGYYQQMVGGTRSVSYYGNSMFLSGNLPRNVNTDHSIQNGYTYMTCGDNFGFQATYTSALASTQTLLRLEARQSPLSGFMIPIGRGIQTLFSLHVYRDPANGNTNSVINDYIGVRVADDQYATLKSEMYFKTTQDRVSVEPLVLRGKDVKQGYADGKQGFYGKEPIDKQSLPQNATAQQILEALENLGLLDIIIP
ncbi:hypothetical protein ACE193_21495 [Bernardetia sp. OM2101]|uniref:hypothetical protein n=1 Tax=Bernardetia sp. OM2101 TaxID=3344876 RepID=UPI0035CFFE5B